MSNWGDGYVTDSVYTSGYYSTQSPRLLSVACMIGGVQGLGGALDGPLSVLELGCGRGHGAMVQAASNPHWQVTAIDFNPAHIAEARSLAAEADLHNIRFLEADLSETLGESIPEADVVTLHGLWSWVARPVQEGVVRLLHEKLRPGGIVYCSYNALPAWSGALGFQRLIHDAGRHFARGGGSVRQAEAGIQMLLALREAGAVHLSGEPYPTALLQRLPEMPAAYVAHEYMNDGWQPCFHADVVRDFSQAKLDWVASAELPENFSELTLTEPQRAIVAQLDDPILRELVKDLSLMRGLRHDVFVRGPRRLSPAASDSALCEVMLALVAPAEGFGFEVETPIGKAALKRSFYEPVLQALSAGPRRLGELVDLPGQPRGVQSPAELVTMLIGSGLVVPVASRPGAPEPGIRLNAAMARRLRRPDDVITQTALAAGMFGNGVPCRGANLMAFARMEAGDRDPSGWGAIYGAEMEEEPRRKLAAILVKIANSYGPFWSRQGLL